MTQPLPAVVCPQQATIGSDVTTESAPSPRTASVVLVLAIVGLIGAVRLLLWYWPGSFFHNPASGTWTALAWDFAHGEFYRPVLSPLGFGGTRYMPVMFMLHGALIWWHLDPITAGVLLMQGSVLSVAIALYVALRAAGVRPVLALSFAATPWASVTYQKFATDMRVDYLSATFVLLAIAAVCVAMKDSRSRWLWSAGAACVLATFSKATEIVFVVPIAFALAAGKTRERAIWFAGLTLAMCVCVFGALEWASAGHLLDNLRATFTDGMHVADLWHRGLPTFLFQLVGDPLIGAMFLLAAWALVVAVWSRTWSAIDSYFLTTTAITAVIFASPGTSSNHMIELQIATALAVAVAVERGRLPDRLVASVCGVLVVVLIALVLPLPWMPSPIRTLQRLGPHQRATVEEIREEFLPPAGSYLSLDPILPVLLHQRPSVLDPFSLNLLVVNDTAAGSNLRALVHARSFGTIVLDDDEGVFARDMQSGANWDERAASRFLAAATPLVRLIASDYAICAVRRPFVILRPRDTACVRT